MAKTASTAVAPAVTHATASATIMHTRMPQTADATRVRAVGLVHCVGLRMAPGRIADFKIEALLDSASGGLD